MISDWCKTLQGEISFTTEHHMAVAVA